MSCRGVGRKRKRPCDIAVETLKGLEKCASAAEVGRRGGWDSVSD